MYIDTSNATWFSLYIYFLCAVISLLVFGLHLHSLWTSAHPPSLAAFPRTYLLLTSSYDVSIHPRYLSVLHIQSCMLPTWNPDDGCGLLPPITWTFRPFVSLQSAIGRFRFLVPPSGTTCLSTSHLRRHSRFSDNDSRPFCFPVPTKTH